MSTKVYLRTFVAGICTLIALIAFFVPQTAFAAESSQDGINIEIASDSASYSTGETITGTATITNTNIYAVEDVTLKTTFPAALNLVANNPNLSAARLASGESLQINFATQAPGSSGGLARTYDGATLAMLVLGLVLLAAFLVLALSRKGKKGNKGFTSLTLLLALTLTFSICATPLQALAGTTSLTAKETITVQGVSYELEAEATYSIPPTQSFTFSIGEVSLGEPVAGAGATLTLADGGTVTAVSGSSGHVTFSDIPMGTHELAQSSVPEGYALMPKKYTVVVSLDGVLINNIPAERFTMHAPKKSETPTINSASNGDISIAGQGVPNQPVFVSIHELNVFGRRVVCNASGEWNINLGGSSLLCGMVVEAYQIEGGKYQSDTVKITVGP